jgi:nucleoside-diphosphate-sugar epimerase
MSKTKAVVVGSLGVIGRYIADRLVAAGDWEVVGLSRRASESSPRFRHIAVDLLDPAAVKAKLTGPTAGLDDVTHVFYAAFQPLPATGNAANFAANIAPNRDMLVNSVTAVDRASKHLKRVVLVTGTKYYGSHLGPFKTPARESDPRHIGPNYYFDQIDWLTGFQKAKKWDWTELRPHTLCGFTPGTAMSILPAIAVYAAISKEMGLPLRFPGKADAYTSVYQVCGSDHLANAALWAALEPRAANQAFNITNGDYFRWKHLWPRIAEVFDMPAGDVQTVSLVQQMADMEPVWEKMAARYGLKRIPLPDLVAWPFADYVFGTTWDVMTSTVKARQHGFQDVVDSEEMFVRLLAKMRRDKIVP